MIALVLCIIALIVFAIFSIFSAKYRPLAKEAFGCVFRMATLRPCETGFDRKLKAKVVAGVFEKSPSAARLVNAHFEILSWIFTIIFFASFAYSAYGAYNLITVGTCDPAHPENCPVSGINGNQTKCDITADFAEFYGAECLHCKAMEPIVAQVENETSIIFDKREVWHNETNKQIMLMHGDDIKNYCDGVLGVPAFYSMKMKTAVCGEISKEELKDFVLHSEKIKKKSFDWGLLLVGFFVLVLVVAFALRYFSRKKGGKGESKEGT